MVEPRVIAEGFAVSPQLTKGDILSLALAGYKTIINNRPDAEEAGQMTAAEAQKIAEENCMNYIHIPVKMSELTTETVEKFSKALQENPSPILAHCKSGTRSCVLWTMATAKENIMSLEELMDCAARGGYDLTRMRPLIEQYINT